MLARTFCSLIVECSAQWVITVLQVVELFVISVFNFHLFKIQDKTDLNFPVSFFQVLLCSVQG